ncbi:copper radical oxidase variant A [Mycena amicta]|nr:copper radical oxidase variant A [Mycena amicta]
MFLGNTDKLYIVDKAQGNAEMIKGHSAWGSVWDLTSGNVDLMDIQTNTFCSSGMHLPNGSYSVFGGNGAVSIGGGDPDEKAAGWDSVLQDFDGSRAIRILSPCTSADDFTSSECQWYDDPTNPAMRMQAQRWYSTAEALGDGTIVLMGGFTGGGYIPRIIPNTDPTLGTSLTYEFFPNTKNQAPQNLQFLFKSSALNAYPHAYLMASGKVFLQANLSTALWDVGANQEVDLPPMPNGVIRTYPASGATAMLPMTPANNYTQTMLFCGGSDIAEPDWGNFSYPFVNTWDVPASNDCQLITPEGDAQYHQEDPLPQGRTMGQFIILPTGKLLIVNGGANGTAGYGARNLLTAPEDMPWHQSFASGPVGTPAMYDPLAPAGKRWSTDGFETSQIARLYHSSAILLPDGAVLVAGSNPNLDVNVSSAVQFQTEYRAEKFYPPYFSGTKPSPQGVPNKLSYGGNGFDVTIPASSYTGQGNDAAKSAMVTVIRPGWTTHGMNMGQRFLQLNNTYTVNGNGTIILHVAQMPPNANLFQPGPAFIFVVVNGIPSNATYAIVGTGNIETQPLAARTVLPASVEHDDATGSGSGSGSDTGSNGGGSGTQTKSTSHVALIAGIAGGCALVALVALGVGICIARRRRARIRSGIAAGKAASARAPPPAGLNFSNVAAIGGGSSPYGPVPPRSPGFEDYDSHSQVFLGHKARASDAWSHSQGTDTDSGVWEAHAQTHVPAMSGLRQQPYRDDAGYGYGQSSEPQHGYQDYQQHQDYQHQDYQPRY